MRPWTLRSMSLAVVLFVVPAAACGGRVPGPKSPRPPNVVLVTLDTTRADRLGCYTPGLGTSPNIDRLAREGVRFDRAIASAAVTPVSHASILTGLHPYRHGLRVMFAGSHNRLPEGTPTLATVLKAAGWRTGAFLSAFTVSEYFGFKSGFETFDSGTDQPADRLVARLEDGLVKWDLRSQRRSDDTTDRALAWVRQSPRPFFLWVHYWDPHDNVLVPPPEVLSRFAVEGGTRDERARGLYDAEVFFVDQQFGRLMQGLRSSGAYDDTLVVVVADHGEGLGDHGWWYHRILYQEQIRLPLIVRLPGGPSGRTVTPVVRSVDIFPTVLEGVGLVPPRPVDGGSLLGLMQGRSEAPRLAYADALNAFDLNASMVAKRPQDGLVFCALDWPWKLIHRPRRPEQDELYDLAKDPHESRNLRAEAPAEAGRLLALLERSGGMVTHAFGEGRDEEVLERLRSLGYVDGEPGAPPGR